MKTDGSLARLNPSQALHLLTTARYADKLCSDIESVLFASKSKSPFRNHKNSLPPGQIKVIEDYLARIRAQLVQALQSQGIALPEPGIEAVHAIRTTLNFVKIAFEDCRPKRMRGYGEVPESISRTLNGLVDEIISSVQGLDSCLAQGIDLDLQGRLERLEETGSDVALVKKLQRIIDNHGLIEFRPTLSMIVERLESPSFEIALFGRVNSGKSSLLNTLLEAEVLPVGVNPMTSVPTRLIYGERPRLNVRYADRKPDYPPIEQLADFVTEERNPANSKHVARIVAELPSPRLREGIVFVDTPGLGSLATAGAAETFAYLPRCDLGVVLVDAGSTLTDEDLATIRLLYDAGAEVSVLLSKSDLVTEEDRKRQLSYISRQISTRLGVRLAAHPVSARGAHKDLLERWLAQEVFPLYETHRQKSQASLRRKIGALREAVAAALRMRLERAAKDPSPSDVDAPAIEARLRNAVGRFEETRRLCLDLAHEIEDLSDKGLAMASTHLISEWRIHDGRSPAALVPDALTDVAGARASLVSGALSDLARELSETLDDTARDLGFTDGHDEADLTSVLREMPRLDLGNWNVSIKPSLWLKLSARMETRRIEQRLRSQIGAIVRKAFYNYAETLEEWAQQTLNDLRLRFDSQADKYRAHLIRLGDGRALSEAEEISVRRDLRQLTRSPPSTEL